MKQLYSTGSMGNGTTGNSPTASNSRSDPGTSAAIRAVSAGVRPDELQTVLSLANYTAPFAKGPSDGRTLPVRLALLKSESGRLLTHVTPNGGTFFAHTLLNVPPTADAQLAIQTWGSPFWQRHEPDSACDLPELPYLPVADLLDDDTLRNWLAVNSRREVLEFVLTALLGTPSTTRIFLVASADDVAKIVYAVTRVLPPGLLDDFTFSTFEPNPLTSPARLVGYEPESAELDLPEACYTNGAVAFHATTGRRSDIQPEVPFARFAVASLVKGDLSALDDLKATWQRLGLKNEARQFDLVFRMARGTGILTKEEAIEALRHPPLAAWLSARADVLSQFLEWALEDREFATSSFSWAVQALRQKPEVLGKLGQSVREQGLKALQAGDRERTANALEVVLPMAAPAKGNAVWGEIAASIADPTQLSWEMRWYLLPRFIRYTQRTGSTGIEPALAKWLDVPAERLGELLALDLPRVRQIAAARACLKRGGEPSPLLVQTLVKHPGLTLTLLQPHESIADSQHLVKLFETLLTEAPTHPWFEELLGRASDYPPELLNRFFEVALAAGKVDADRVIRAQGARLLEIFAGQSGLDRVGSQFLTNPPDDLLTNPGLLDFLAKLRIEPQVSDALKERIAAVQSIRSYLDAPDFVPATMSTVAAAPALTPPVVPASTKSDIFAALTKQLARRAKEDGLQADLESTLVHFGEVLGTDSADLYQNLLRDLRKNPDFGKQPGLVTTFLAVALGATQSPELAGKLDGLDGAAFAVAAEGAKRGGSRLLEEVNKRSEAWPRAARAQWGFLLAAVRPRGYGGLVRDTALVLAGAAVAVLVLWGIQFAGR